MTNKRFQRPVGGYSGSSELLYTDKYQQDSKAVPKVAISSSKIDGDFNYVIDAVNTLDEDIKAIVYSGISNETILSEHLSEDSVTEEKIADDSITTSAIKCASITNSKIADLSVDTVKIANNSITKDKLAVNSVGTQEVIDGSITRDKLADDAIADSIPVGTIAQFSASLLPTGWILCNGATLNKNTYPQLVRFLTNSDTEQTAIIPNLNTNEESIVQFAIKAFSDTIDLANFDVAGLTQDFAVLEPKVAVNTKKGEEHDLWSGSAGGNSLITLSKSINSFSYLTFSLKVNSYAVVYTIPVSQIKLLTPSNVLNLDNSNHVNTQYIAIYLKDENTIATAQRYSTITLNKIIGIK